MGLHRSDDDGANDDDDDDCSTEANESNGIDFTVKGQTAFTRPARVL